MIATQAPKGARRAGARFLPGAAERLPGFTSETPQRLREFFERRADVSPGATALVCETDQLTYAQLEERANRLARYLEAEGAGPGGTAGILLERSVLTYVALLAVVKTGAAFVPIDPAYPADRIQFIAEDAGLSMLLTTSGLAAAIPPLECTVTALDTIASELERMPATRPAMADSSPDSAAYIIYTSGTTGRPKGVAVSQRNICHFLANCTPAYAVEAEDRVYQGMTIAFDFSIEEIWPTWIAGAALVAGPTDGGRLGPALAEFLERQRISVLYCVPTLLATIDRDVPSLRTLIVGGEACPRDLVERWSRPGRRMLNTYGPTETTVTATWGELEPGRRVTIGRPMPGYRVHILDEQLRPLPDGRPGEICIAGAGVATGYLNRPELNAEKFVADPFEPGAKLYRTGDLGRFTSDGEIEFLGRIDSQVKIRGYRIELSEIEAVLLEQAAVENAVVSAVPPNGPAEDLAAYVVTRGRVAAEDVREQLAEALHRRLPPYMVPAYIELLDAIPMLPSGKADRKHLPPPSLPRVGARTSNYVEPETRLERKLASAWSDIFGRDRISVEADFFLELGGHSLSAAQLVSRLRNDGDFRQLSVADLYSHPTIRALAKHAGKTSEAEPEAAPRREESSLRHGDARVWKAGAAQLALLYAVFAMLLAPLALMLARHGGQTSLAFTGWDALLSASMLLAALALPVALKWTLIGRFRPGRYPLWGSYFVRWWIVRKALDFSPMPLLAGSPLLPLYARLLGARIGRGCHIETPQLHLPDMIEIGDGASLGYEVEVQPFRVAEGWLEIAPIRIGADAFVGTKSVIMLGSRIGDGAKIAEQTLVARDQEIPAGERWSGSPAQRDTRSDPVLEAIGARPAASQSVSGLLWAGFAASFLMLEALPLALALPGLFLLAWADRQGGFPAVLAAIPAAGLLFVLSTCAVVAAGKWLAMPGARPGIYPVDSAFGLRKWLSDKFMLLSLTVTNTLYSTLYAVPWLRALGARVGARSEVSTVSHIEPQLLSLGSETFVADIASAGAAVYHNGYVALGRTEIGSRTFLGNASVIRGNTTLPENCLIGVQSVAPAEPAQPGTSWLGSPAIFLPRRQLSDQFADTLTFHPPAALVAYRLFVEFFRIILPSSLLYLMGALLTRMAVASLGAFGPVALIAGLPAVYFASAALVTLLIAGLKWTVTGRYRPRVEPLWAPFVRHTELITGLYESAAVPALLAWLTGTPFAAPLLRAFGVQIGRRVYLETTYMTEFDLVRLGDDVAVGRATSLQTHLFEDRVMKMSTVSVGSGCTIGPRAVVLYDAVLHDGAQLDALSLAMKGESIPAATHWRGIPARLAGRRAGAHAARNVLLFVPRKPRRPRRGNSVDLA